MTIDPKCANYLALLKSGYIPDITFAGKEHMKFTRSGDILEIFIRHSDNKISFTIEENENPAAKIAEMVNKKKDSPNGMLLRKHGFAMDPYYRGKKDVKYVNGGTHVFFIERGTDRVRHAKNITTSDRYYGARIKSAIIWGQEMFEEFLNNKRYNRKEI